MHNDEAMDTGADDAPLATTEQKGQAVKKGSRMAPLLQRRFLVISLAVLLLLGLNAGISMLVSASYQQETVEFDMKGTIDTFKQQSSQAQLTKETAEVLTRRFSSALESSLNAWRQKHGGIILVKGAVVSGAQDITPEIQSDIARQMQGAQ
ncbi:type-F conjugative transfer system protein TrbI [Pantoea sp. BS_8]|uniref:type-F conjugative transfer system protein TrbI n=1 Tax=Pantoea sp. BS_8 TaxID=3055781 RepID=UPI0035C023B8